MMNDKARKEQPATDKKKTGKRRPNMMSNQGPGEDASTGVFVTGMGVRTKKRTMGGRTMGGMFKYGK